MKPKIFVAITGLNLLLFVLNILLWKDYDWRRDKDLETRNRVSSLEQRFERVERDMPQIIGAINGIGQYLNTHKHTNSAPQP